MSRNINQTVNTMFKSIAAAAVLLIACGVNASAQSSATATATATIVTPITISKTADMDFGNVAVQASTGGTVVMAPSGSRTATAGVTLPASAGSPAAASFTVSGQANYTYAITLPASVTLTQSGGSNTMTVSSFTSTPSATGTLSGSGSQTLDVGGTLTVAAAQAPGVYTSGTPFVVTVNYN